MPIAFHELCIHKSATKTYMYYFFSFFSLFEGANIQDKIKKQKEFLNLLNYRFINSAFFLAVLVKME